MDDYPVEDAKRFVQEFATFLEIRATLRSTAIRDTGDLSDETEETLKAAIAAFHEVFAPTETGPGSEAALGETTPPDEVKPDVGWDRMSSVDEDEEVRARSLEDESRLTRRHRRSRWAPSYASSVGGSDRSSRRRRSPGDGAHRELAHREGAAARGGVAPVRDPAHRGDGRPGPRNSGCCSHPCSRSGPSRGRPGCSSARPTEVSPAATANVIEEAEGVLASVRDRGLEPVLYVSGGRAGYFRFGGPGPRRLAGAHRSAGLRRRAGDRHSADRRLRGRGDRRVALRVHRLPLRVHAARDREVLPIAPEEVSGPARRVCTEYLFEPAPERILDACCRST